MEAGTDAPGTDSGGGSGGSGGGSAGSGGLGGTAGASAAGGHAGEGTGGTGATSGSGGEGAAAGQAGSAGAAGATQAPCQGVIGPMPVEPTPLAQATHFAAPNGTSKNCTEAAPCDVWTAIANAGPGSVVFLRGGVYPVSKSIAFHQQGTQTGPITIESYPGELAIFDGSSLKPGTQVYIRVTGAFYHLRRFEVRHMPMQGIWIGGTDNTLDGIVAHHNKLSGIQIFSPYEEYPYGKYGSRNTLRNCVAHDNSGVGLLDPEFADGGNSDGISISSGADNEVDHCLVYLNSDDGIDTWRSTGSSITCSVARQSGLGSGDGNGFKAGGKPPSDGTVVRRCISYRNKQTGFDYNSGKNVVFEHVTAVEDHRGFWTGDDTQLMNSVVVGDSVQGYGSGQITGNCWQTGGSPEFISMDPTSPDFMRPLPGSPCSQLGAAGQ
ncbi:MAG: Pectate lyase L precursor [Deltaproteobacteria bacterium ADurb.Bin207]|nr:MAG: Pectate lyase L precursor [Deltaproteobacteria bacterium ADurb.Bin207]